MKHLPPAASVTPWLYWSIFPVHRAFVKLYFGQIVTKRRCRQRLYICVHSNRFKEAIADFTSISSFD